MQKITVIELIHQGHRTNICIRIQKRNSVFDSSLGGEGLLVYRIDRRYEGKRRGPPMKCFCIDLPTVHRIITV
jgi:hypothetical protein